MRPRKQILLVGKDQESLGVLAYTLRIEGYAVARAHSASEAVERIREHQRALLLCEWPLEGLADLLVQGRALDPYMPSMVLAARLGDRPADFLAHATLRNAFPNSELLERIKAISARRRGPKSGRKPPAIDTAPGAPGMEKIECRA